MANGSKTAYAKVAANRRRRKTNAARKKTRKAHAAARDGKKGRSEQLQKKAEKKYRKASTNKVQTLGSVSARRARSNKGTLGRGKGKAVVKKKG